MAGKVRWKGFLLAGVVCLVLLCCIFFWMVNNNLSPQLKSMAEAKIKAFAASLFNQSLSALVAQPGVYDQLIDITRGETGQVTLLTANVLKMNALSNRLAAQMQQALSNAPEQSLSLRWGAALGSDFFSNMGPKITVRTQPIGAVSVDYVSEFASAGINQTRHRIYVQVLAEIRVILPYSSTTVTVEDRLLMAESIIVGMTPNTFVNVTDVADALNLIP